MAENARDGPGAAQSEQDEQDEPEAENQRRAQTFCSVVLSYSHTRRYPRSTRALVATLGWDRRFRLVVARVFCPFLLAPLASSCFCG